MNHRSLAESTIPLFGIAVAKKGLGAVDMKVGVVSDGQRVNARDRSNLREFRRNER